MITEMLKQAMGMDNIKDLCVSIDLRDAVYPMCFIRKETLKYLIVDSTGVDGCERVVIVPKSNILSVNVVYEQDIDFEEKEDVMFL